MAYPTLREFLNDLDKAGEVKRIRSRVSPVIEIAALADAASKSPAPSLPSASARRNDPRFHHLGGPAILCEDVEGSNIPVLINAYGSYRRMEMALGCASREPIDPEPSIRSLGALPDSIVSNWRKRYERARGGTRPDARGPLQGGFDALGARIGELVKPEPPKSLTDLVVKARQFLPLLRTPPKRRRGRGLCQEVVIEGDAVDLTRLPLIRCWEHDGDFSHAAFGYPAGINDHIVGLGRGREWDERFRGRYVTLAGIHTIHAADRDNPKPSSHNIGMYRVQLLGKRMMAMHWHMHHDGARHWRSWKAVGKPMPVAIALGGEAVLPYAATAPLPPGISEVLLAGFLNGGGIEMVRGRTVPLWVPANAEIVIEGYVSHEAGMPGWGEDLKAAHLQSSKSQSPGGSMVPHAGGSDDRFGIGPGAVFEGPFGDHTGFYSLPDRYPVLTVTAITHRRDPIYPTTVVGLPPQEDYFLGKATERIFLPLLKTLIPDIEDYDLPMFGAFHNCAFVKIRKHYPLHARRVMHAIWGAGQMSWTKSIFVVDDDVDVHDTAAVLEAAAERCHPMRDVERVRGPLDILDHAAPRLAAGTKFGLDCTRKIEGEQCGNAAPLNRLRRASSQMEAAGGRSGLLSESAQVIVARVRSLPGVTDAALHAEGWLIVSTNKTEPRQGWAIAEALGASFSMDFDGSRATDRGFERSVHQDGLTAKSTDRAEPRSVARDVLASPTVSGSEDNPGTRHGVSFAIIVDASVDVRDPQMPFFHWLAHSDLGRDAWIFSTRALESEFVSDSHFSVLVIDATPKLAGEERFGEPVRRWPPILSTSAKLSQRARDLLGWSPPGSA